MHVTKLGKHFSLKDSIILLLGWVLFVIAGITNHQNPKPQIILEKQDTAINLNKNILLFLNFGNRRIIADFLWIQTLLESDNEHYKQKDLNSWMYLRFLNISYLDPMFFENYVYGGLYLSIIKDDVLGAAEIFERGLIFYPDNYKLNYYAGFNYYFEQGNFKKGIKFLERIKNYPEAPPFITQIIGKLKFETTGDFDIALTFLKDQYQQAEDSFLKEKLSADIYSVQAEKDLKCLNSINTNCHQIDAEGFPYIKKNNKWVTRKPFTNYRIFLPKRIR